MKRVLIITYYWPPAGGPGVQRCLKFVKYLRDYGWEPVIYTASNPEVMTFDSSYEDDIPAGIEIIKKPIREPFNLYKKFTGAAKDDKTTEVISSEKNKSLTQKISLWVRANLFIPDAKILWIKPSINHLVNYLKDNPVDIIFSTSPPPTVHLIAKGVVKKTKLPWVADFRDPWVNLFNNDYLPITNWAKKIDLRKETSVLNNADCIIGVTPGIVDEFKDRAKRIELIYNGYDANDVVVENKKPTNEFSLVYTGTFKPSQNLEELWKAIRELLDEDVEFGEKFKLRFIGRVPPETYTSIRSNNLEHVTDYAGYLPHKGAVVEMLKASLLLFIIPQGKSNRKIMTGKIFEYLASRSEMLSIGPKDGNAAKALEECERSSMIDYKDKEEIKQSLLKSFMSWKNDGNIASQYEEGSHSKFSRHEQTKRLSEIFFEIIDQDGN